jgi:hypothetical protein
MSSKDEPLVTIATYGPLHEATIAKAKLELAGIEAFLSGEHVSSLEGMFAFGVRLQVPKSQVEAARAALAAEAQPAQGAE